LGAAVDDDLDVAGELLGQSQLRLHERGQVDLQAGEQLGHGLGVGAAGDLELGRLAAGADLGRGLAVGRALGLDLGLLDLDLAVRRLPGALALRVAGRVARALAGAVALTDAAALGVLGLAGALALTGAGAFALAGAGALAIARQLGRLAAGHDLAGVDLDAAVGLALGLEVGVHLAARRLVLGL